MLRVAMLLSVTAVTLSGCAGGLSGVPLQERVGLRVHTAVYLAKLDPVSEHEETALVPRSKCTFCKGSGKIKSGDGLSVVTCSHCYDDSETGEDHGTGPTAPAIEQEEEVLTAPLNTEELTQDLWSAVYPSWTWTAVETEPQPDQPYGLDLSPEEEAVTEFLKRQPTYSTVVVVNSVQDRDPATAIAMKAGANLMGSYWPVTVVSREEWPELCDRLCVESAPMLVALQSGRVVSTAEPQTIVHGEKATSWTLLSDGWPASFHDQAAGELALIASMQGPVAAGPVSRSVHVYGDFRSGPVDLQSLREDLQRYAGTTHGETAVVGMTVETHLTRDHGWPADVVAGLTPQEKSLLHSASHDGVIVRNTDPGVRVLPNTVGARPASNCPGGNCNRPAWGNGGWSTVPRRRGR
jgi:hypothetical protein